MNKLKDLSVIGIDLTGSEEKPSGCCYLKGNFAQTCMIKSNEEIYKYILENKPTLVSLDSPLSLPKGRNTAFDDDINRKKYGITRLCERELMKRGVKVYPSLINSMQKLTTRGIKIANYLRKRGIPVIESYPGAAQDVLHIPRKKTDLSLLKNGLIDFGLDIEKDVICHDEVDAITSALVGYFFWQGNYEALGNEDENFLIIPDLRKERVSKHKILVIGFSGPICSGKTTASYFLKNSGFAYLRFSLILEKILINQKIKKSRENLQKLGNHVFEKKGQYWLCKKLIKSIKAQNNIVIDGLRHPEDYTFFVERYGADFKLIFIDSSLETRLKRIRDFNPEKYLDYINHKSENDVKQLLGLSSIKITNEYNMETFKKDILDLMEFEE